MPTICDVSRMAATPVTVNRTACRRYSGAPLACEVVRGSGSPPSARSSRHSSRDTPDQISMVRSFLVVTGIQDGQHYGCRVGSSVTPLPVVAAAGQVFRCSGVQVEPDAPFAVEPEHLNTRTPERR